MTQITLNGNKALDGWFERHERDYERVLERLAGVRAVTLAGDLEPAAENLRKSYLFAVLSIQTERDRHERAFTRLCAGEADVREAAKDTVYGNQKADWIHQTLEETDWTAAVQAVRAHVRNGRTAELLGMHDEFVGVSFRKWAFTLAMAGVWEMACVDSNVGAYLGVGERDADNADEYADVIARIRDSLAEPVPPFLAQWAIYDYERGEHARHMAFFREVNGAFSD